MQFAIIITYIIGMKLYPRSIRQKITMGYTALALLIVAFVMLSWNNLSSLQEMVTSGEAVTGLFDTTLEIRRFEKNYFLYWTDDDYRELQSYIDDARGWLDNDDLYVFTTPETVDGLKVSLEQYSDLLTRLTAETRPEERQALERAIREKGKEIVTVTEQISSDMSASKSEALQSVKQQLLAGIGLLLAAILFGGIFFYRKTVKPLSALEGHMKRITAGEFSLIPARSRDRELVSLEAAFNRMLLELMERQKSLVQSEKLASLGTLVFGVAHELNNPLSNISTSCQILREEVEDGDVEFRRELLEQIDAETDRARDVVRSLLEYSRSKEKRSFSFRRAVDETIRFMRVEIPAGVNIRTDVSGDLVLYGDRQMIQQMILNLVKNAVDAVQGDGEVDLRAVRENGSVIIKVADNGAGIAKERLAKIFDPFHTSKEKGYGLGLFIVGNIVDDHGGTISVDSTPGQGTVFTIRLPAERL